MAIGLWELAADCGGCWNGVAECDGSGKEMIFYGLSSGTGHQKFHRLTSSWSFGEFEADLGSKDVNLATCDFVRGSGLGDCPVGLQGVKLYPRAK